MSNFKRRGRRVGTLHNPKTGEWVADVEFVVYRTGPDEAFGRIWALGDLRSSSQVHGSQPALPDGGRNYVLATDKGAKIEIVFEDATNGAFACAIPSQLTEDETLAQ